MSIQILELFKGTGSWSKPYLNNNKYEVITLDIDNNFNPVINIDILKWDYKDSIVKNPKVIYASPVCTYFSISQRVYGYKEDKIKWTKSLWHKTYEILEYFKPKFYLIENPMGKAREYFPHYETLDYCMYNNSVKYRYAYSNNIEEYFIRKRTDIWTNINLEFRKCDKSHKHINLQRSGLNKTEQGIIPKGLTNLIFNIIDNVL